VHERVVSVTASWQHARMNMKKKRRSFEAGHFRKFLLIVDESQEVESALYYVASRIQHSSGSIVMLYVIVPQEFQHWINVRQQQVEEETTKAKALFRLFRRKLNLAGFEGVASEEIIREGAKGEEIRKLIDEDEDIAVLVLGASTDPAGPGPLVSSLAAGTAAGSFPIPITIGPGTLTFEDIQALA
jgi:nucleotide-binding universal stress UspA family protein